LLWTKDKRLPAAGTSKIRRGQVVSLSIYTVDVVEQLIRDPDRIRARRDVVVGGTFPG
jgi:hypothetical protein